MALEVVLRFIFGDDYERVGFHFDLLSQEPARNMEFACSFRALGRIILQVIDRRRKDSAISADVLGMLVQARDPESGQAMQDSQLIDEILTLIVAGHETTASTLNWAWYLISQHPEVEQRLSSELTAVTAFECDDPLNFIYTKQIIDEAMRLYPAGWLVTRTALRGDRLGEYFVPAGTEIYLPPYFIQRHPDLWQEPERFNPDRFLPQNSRYRHRLATIPFSAARETASGQLLPGSKCRFTS